MDETDAIDLISALGYDKAHRRLTELFDEAQRKMDALLDGCHPGFIPSGYGPRNHMTDEQLTEVHLLTLGLDILYNPRRMARAKVLERLKQRRPK